MKIFVRTLDKVITSLKVELSDMIDKLRQQIHQETGFKPYSYTVLFAGRQLEQYQTFVYYNIQNENIIHITQRVVPKNPLRLANADNK